MHTQFWSENLKGQYHAEYLRSTWKDNVRMDLMQSEWEVWTGFLWLRVGNSGGILRTW